jgi:NitT/TauT family transport system substrate-binding protein
MQHSSMNPTRVLRRHVLAGALLACTFAGSALAQEKLIPLRVGYDGYSMTTAPMSFALKKGIFKKHGIDLTLVYVDGGPTLTQAVVGGSVDIGQNGYTPVAAAAVAGADLVFIGGISNKLPFQLVVKNEIKNAADLKGKKIAISRYGSSTDTAATFAVENLGLKRTDVSILQLGGEGTRTAAMLSGQIDASLEQYPRTAELMEQGYHVLVDVTGVAGDYPNTSYVTRRSFVEKNPDTIKRFMAAISEGIHVFKTNRTEAEQATAEFLKLKIDKVMDITYTRYVDDIFPDVPAPSLKGIQIVLDELKAKEPAAAKFTPEQLVDTRALDQLKSEGFFEKLKK